MDKLVKELKALLVPYAEEQGATFMLHSDLGAQTLHAELIADTKAASVDYGPEDFELDDPTAADIFEFLKTAWVNA